MNKIGDSILDLSIAVLLAVCLVKIALGSLGLSDALALGICLLNLYGRKVLQDRRELKEAELRTAREAALMKEASDYTALLEQLKEQKVAIEALQTSAAFHRVGR